jgi:AcrR family transcriptional regulator
MSPRRYRSDRRQAAADETRRRIVDSTVDLHAEQGVLATSYAMVARRADVAVPTVYNHFPTRGDLLAACTGQAAALAPPLGPEMYADGDDVDARLLALVRALSAYYHFFEPWLRWTNYEAPLVPELAAWLGEAADARRRLLVLALEPAFGAEPPAALVALSDVLLDYSAWQRLASEPGLAPAAAEAALSGALAALVERHRADTTVTAPVTTTTAARRRRKPRIKPRRKRKSK